MGKSRSGKSKWQLLEEIENETEREQAMAKAKAETEAPKVKKADAIREAFGKVGLDSSNADVTTYLAEHYPQLTASPQEISIYRSKERAKAGGGSGTGNGKRAAKGSTELDFWTGIELWNTIKTSDAGVADTLEALKQARDLAARFGGSLEATIKFIEEAESKLG